MLIFFPERKPEPKVKSKALADILSMEKKVALPYACSCPQRKTLNDFWKKFSVVGVSLLKDVPTIVINSVFDSLLRL